MSGSTITSSINLPILRGIYSKILAHSTSHVCPLMLSGKIPLIAFWQFVSDVSEATVIRDEPVRIDLSLHKKGTLSIHPTDGSFGRRILDYGIRNIKTLTVEIAPIWVRNWLKEFVNHDRLEELIIGRKVEKGAFPVLAQIAESVKKLSDKTGQVVSKLEEGDFEYLSINMMNFSWPQNLLSNMKFTTKYFRCVVDERCETHTLAAIKRQFAKVSSEKLAAVKTFHIVFNFVRAQRDFQPFIDTIVEIMPNVRTIVLNLKTEDPGLQRAYKFLPSNIGRTYEGIQQLVPPLGVTIKTKVTSVTKSFAYDNDLELPTRITDALGCMQRVPLGRNVKVSTSTRALKNERNRYQQFVFDAGNEMGGQKEFSADLTIYVEIY
uniref:DUF38 domain-containing protein n=1 Tax=Panagrellus redivivus TaxID=6233 RepID=A0A7E4VYV1_PANRE